MFSYVIVCSNWRGVYDKVKLLIVIILKSPVHQETFPTKRGTH